MTTTQSNPKTDRTNHVKRVTITTQVPTAVRTTATKDGLVTKVQVVGSADLATAKALLVEAGYSILHEKNLGCGTYQITV